MSDSNEMIDVSFNLADLQAYVSDWESGGGANRPGPVRHVFATLDCAIKAREGYSGRMFRGGCGSNKGTVKALQARVAGLLESIDRRDSVAAKTKLIAQGNDEAVAEIINTLLDKISELS